ncbi:MAG: hypothetical protein DRI57_14040, partial [Deltaproteobacteria bacterium]
MPIAKIALPYYEWYSFKKRYVTHLSLYIFSFMGYSILVQNYFSREDAKNAKFFSLCVSAPLRELETAIYGMG